MRMGWIVLARYLKLQSSLDARIVPRTELSSVRGESGDIPCWAAMLWKRQESDGRAWSLELLVFLRISEYEGPMRKEILFWRSSSVYGDLRPSENQVGPSWYEKRLLQRHVPPFGDKPKGISPIPFELS